MNCILFHFLLRLQASLARIRASFGITAKLDKNSSCAYPIANHVYFFGIFDFSRPNRRLFFNLTAWRKQNVVYRNTDIPSRQYLRLPYDPYNYSPEIMMSAVLKSSRQFVFSHIRRTDDRNNVANINKVPNVDRNSSYCPISILRIRAKSRIFNVCFPLYVRIEYLVHPMSKTHLQS